MGAAFNRWPARPSTSRLLRQFTRPNPRRIERPWCTYDGIGETRSARRYAATAVSHAATKADDTVACEQQNPLISKFQRRESLRDALHMSLRSGVALLEKETGYGAYRALQTQTKVEIGVTSGELLVDQPDHRNNLRLWIEILQFRHRCDGSEGVHAVWHGMRLRGVDLPTDGEEADLLWSTFANACIDEDGVTHVAHLNELCEHAKELQVRTGLHYSNLYKTIMSRLMRFDQQHAGWRHNWFLGAELLPSDAARQIIADALGSGSIARALRVLKKVYTTSSDRDFYDVCIAELLKLKHPQERQHLTLMWHRFLLKHGDGPSQAFFATPAVQKLFERDKNKALPMVHAALKGIDDSETVATEPEANRVEYPTLTRSSMSSLLGDVHGIKPKEISDHFVAKIFATHAFSLDLIVRGLSFFGVDQLGPLALREMAVRAGSLVAFSNKLEDLRNMDISTSSTVYCRLVQIFVRERHTDLFQQLLESDQHPEAYDDPAEQEVLLASYLDQSQWNKAHITLLALSLGGAAPEGRGWNRMLQHYLHESQWGQVARIIRFLQSQRVPLTIKSITWLHTYLLPLRRPSKRPIPWQRHTGLDYDPLALVTTAYMYTEELERRVHHRLWTELLKRYGMNCQWEGLEKLVLWIAGRSRGARFWTRLNVPVIYKGKCIKYRQRWTLKRSSPAHNVFQPTMQQAIVHWGFRSAAVRNQLSTETAKRQVNAHFQYVPSGNSRQDGVAHENWAQGIALLARLKRDFCLPINTNEVRHAFKLRMLSLFGPGYSKMAVNEEVREKNKFTLGHYIRLANEVWGGEGDDTLIKVNDALLESDSEHNVAAQAKLLVPFFGRMRSVNQRKKEIVDVASWGEDQQFARSSTLRRGRTVSQRKSAWQRSPYRLIRRVQSQKRGEND